ncbi:MAG: clostripain-related cysteine peptidase [Negativicutes bacterium]|nr:clostripain-related cysteine peptidase [Negativicutes bacterium]
MDQIEQEKDWTILIYANGNNELMPEMWRAKTDAEKIGSDDNVNVVLQISREKNELVTIIRPYEALTPSRVKWIGARRYFLINGKADLIKDLGRINMANPMTLCDFLTWGMNCYPAKRYMLVLGGHGYQFVGAMTDYSQSVPYIMGIPELCEALQLACSEPGRKIDVLVLDICYFNLIEPLYEFGKEENHAVQNIITYIRDGPLQGLSYDKLVQAVRCNRQNSDMSSFLRQIVDSLDFDLVAVEINHNKLSRIKRLFSDLADCYLAAKKGKGTQLHELFSANPEDDWYTLANSVKSTMQSLIHCHKIVTNSKSFLLNSATVPTNDWERLARYARLSFAQNNSWTYLLSNEAFCNRWNGGGEIELSPTMLSAQEIFTYITIVNPSLPEQARETIFEKLLQYKKWVL